jgi:hypothetical protein
MGKKRGQSPSRSAAAAQKPAETEEEPSQTVPVEPPKEPIPPISVVYCQGKCGRSTRSGDLISCLIVCTFPVEYCEFGSSLTRCKEWLKEENQEMYGKYYSDGMYESVSPHCSILTLCVLQRLSRQRWGC